MYFPLNFLNLILMHYLSHQVVESILFHHWLVHYHFPSWSLQTNHHLFHQSMYQHHLTQSIFQGQNLDLHFLHQHHLHYHYQYSNRSVDSMWLQGFEQSFFFLLYHLQIHATDQFHLFHHFQNVNQCVTSRVKRTTCRCYYCQIIISSLSDWNHQFL